MTKKIKIYDLLPFMKKGWVAYDGKYWLYSTKKPNHTSWERWDPGYGEDNWNLNDIFRLEPFKGRWQDSLIRVAYYQKDTKSVVNSKTKKIVHKKEKLCCGLN